MTVAWIILLWSLGVLLDGRWPLTDWRQEPWPEKSKRARLAGSPLCMGYVFPVMCLSADLDYLCNYLQLTHFNSAGRNCFRCLCDRMTRPWTDMRPGAAWRAVPVTPATWLLTEKHAVFEASRVGLNVFHVCIDVLHTLDLGVSQYVVGGGLYLLAFDGGLAGKLNARLDMLWTSVGNAYDALGTPAGERLQEANFRGLFENRRSGFPSTYPSLHVKAAVARHSMGMLRVLLQRLAPDTEPFGHLQACVGGIAHFYDAIMAHGIWLPPDAACEAADALLQAGAHLQTMCSFWRRYPRQLFYITEKAHYAQHIALDLVLTGFNPRFGWTYGDEDFMGRIAQVARACLKGRGPLRVGHALVYRWRRVKYLRWRRRLLT